MFSLQNPIFGLDPKTIAKYNKRGMFEMYQWQYEAIIMGIQGKNLVYSAPTSSGKTFVAEILSIKRTKRQSKTLFIVPYISLAVEKQRDLQNLFHPLKVGGFYGTESSKWENCSVAVCTMEKANSLFNRLLEENKQNEIGTIVVDELHMIREESRGYLLELLLSKVIYMKCNIQIIGMSATLPNLNILAKWLNAEMYETNFRCVPLTEYIKVEREVYNIHDIHVPVRKITQKTQQDPDQVVELCQEVTRDKKSVLVFCATKNQAENCAKNVSKLITSEKDERRLELLENLRKTPCGLDPLLAVCCMQGIGYHHAGLSMEERELIEEAFRQNIILIICATCTLGVGVNLPARRVIFRSPYMGRMFLDPNSYQQMKGRAGRKGLDSEGESIIICQSRDVDKVISLIDSHPSAVFSCLSNVKLLMRAILEVISAKVVNSKQNLEEYISQTLFFQQNNLDLVQQAVLNLEAENLIIDYMPSKLGEAITASGLRLEQAKKVYTDLSKALQNFVLMEELHVVYHCTPVDGDMELNWGIFHDIFQKLTDSQKMVAVAVGVSDDFIGYAKFRGVNETEDTRVHQRFWRALILNDLIHEMPMQQVTQKYDVRRGSVQGLQQSGSQFCGILTVFCERLGWSSMEVLVKQLCERFDYGVQNDLIPLMKIPHVKRYRARSLFKAGLTDVVSVATSNVEFIAQVISSKPTRTDLKISSLIIEGAIEILKQEKMELENKLNGLVYLFVLLMAGLGAGQSPFKRGLERGGFSSSRNLDTAFTCALTLGCLSAAIIGVIQDKKGANLVMMSGCLGMCLGMGCLSVYLYEPWEVFLFIGLGLILISGSSIMSSSFGIIGPNSIQTLLLNVCFDLSALIYALMELAERVLDPILVLRTVHIFYTCFAFIAMIISRFFQCKENKPRSFGNQNRRMTLKDAVTIYYQAPIKEEENAKKKLKKTYILFLCYCCILILGLNFFMLTVNNQFPDEQMLTAWSIMLPVCSILVIPILGPMLVYFDYFVLFFLCTFVSISAYSLILAQNMFANYLCMALLAVLRPIIWTLSSDFIIGVFGLPKFGRGYGILMLAAGLTNFIAYGLSFVNSTVSNSVLLSLQLISFYFPIYLRLGKIIKKKDLS